MLKSLIPSWKWIGLPLKFWSFRGGSLIECLKSFSFFLCYLSVRVCRAKVVLAVVSKIWLIRGCLNWFCPTNFSCWLMHIGAWIVKVTGAWKFDGTREPGINWLLHNWQGWATYCLTGKVLVRPRCWKLGAAEFKMVFWCCCSIRGTVIEATLEECTPVIGLLQWLDCRRLFFATILLV